MKTTLAILFGMGLMAGCVAASEGTDFEAAVRMFEERDLRTIQHARLQHIEGFSLEQRNRVALAAAKSLDISAEPLSVTIRTL